MKTFYLISYENGKVSKEVRAFNLKDAEEQLQEKGYDTQNDYYVFEELPEYGGRNPYFI